MPKLNDEKKIKNKKKGRKKEKKMSPNEKEKN